MNAYWDSTTNMNVNLMQLLKSVQSCHEVNIRQSRNRRSTQFFPVRQNEAIRDTVQTVCHGWEHVYIDDCSRTVWRWLAPTSLPAPTSAAFEYNHAHAGTDLIIP